MDGFNHNCGFKAIGLWRFGGDFCGPDAFNLSHRNPHQRERRGGGGKHTETHAEMTTKPSQLKLEADLQKQTK